MRLHSYFRSSAAYRVRIALGLKGLAFDTVPVHLVRDGGVQHSPSYTAINPEQLVPTLQVDDAYLSQSLAILEFIEEQHPTPPLLPADALARAWVRAVASQVACDIHPINNLRVLQYLEGVLGVTPAQKVAWVAHWIATGFEALETRLTRDGHTGQCCFGDTPTLADCCLVPQVFNARRFNVPLDAYPTIVRIDAHLARLDAFQQATPAAQPDAE
ncbi:MAG: maleylacetoacetate isomerase [Burkholderiales bacterium]